MNERIQQLAEQADNFADNKIQMPGEYHPDWHDVRDEKLAELIVQDCIDIISPYTVKMSRPGEEYLHPITEIKKHFGVK